MKLLPLSIVAKRIGLSIQWVREAIECNELPAYNLSNGKKRPRWFVDEKDMENFLEKRKTGI